MGLREAFCWGMCVSTVVTGCHRAPPDDAIAAAVDRRLAELGIHPMSGASSSTTAPAGSAKVAGSDAQDAATASIAFLARLDDLMKDYKPELPVVEDKSDVLRCVTTDAAKTGTDIGKAATAMKSRSDASKQERRHKEKEFYDSAYPLAFHYDLDWKTRMTAPTPAVFRCFNANNYGFSDVRVGTWVPRINRSDTQEGCQFYGFEWRQFSTARAPVFTYSGSDTAPRNQPELMSRMDAAKITLPKRFSCRVDDVVTEGDRKIIHCATAGTAVVVRVSDSLPMVNIGDVVSVPLAGAKVDPEGVLSKSVGSKAAHWTVAAVGSTVRIDLPASCPTVDEILSAGGITPTPMPSASASSSSAVADPSASTRPTLPPTPADRKDCQACSFNDACTVVQAGKGPCCKPIRNDHDCPDLRADSPLYGR
ncbi:MAG: hypothetical protein ACHREM_26860 [Polyangiales bacterium]